MTDWGAIASAAVREHGASQKPEELAALLALLAGRRPRVITEIGCDAGGTLWAWAQLPGPPRVIGVDLPGDVYAASPDGFPQAHGAELIIGNSRHRGTRARLQAALRGEAIDMLFIDADHCYQAVHSDYHAYRPLVAPGGLIVFHDIIPHPDYPATVGVRQLWTEISHLWPSQEIIMSPRDEWAGIGILENTPLPAPEPLRLAAR